MREGTGEIPQTNFLGHGPGAGHFPVSFAARGIIPPLMPTVPALLPSHSRACFWKASSLSPRLVEPYGLEHKQGSQLTLFTPFPPFSFSISGVGVVGVALPLLSFRFGI